MDKGVCGRTLVCSIASLFTFLRISHAHYFFATDAATIAAALAYSRTFLSYFPNGEKDERWPKWIFILFQKSLILYGLDEYTKFANFSILIQFFVYVRLHSICVCIFCLARRY